VNGYSTRNSWFGVFVLAVCAVWLIWRADQRTLGLAVNSLRLAAGVCVFSIPLGTGLGLLVCRTDLPMRRAILVVWLAFLFVPLYLQAAAWDAGFGRLGWYSMAGATFDVPWMHGWFAAIWIQVMQAIPWVLLIVGAALTRAEPELEDDARLHGGTWWVVWRVTLRRSWGGIAIATLWVAVLTSSDMTVTDLYQIRTLVEELYTGFALYDTTSSIPGLWSSVFATGCLAALIGLALRSWSVRPLDRIANVPRAFELGRWRWAWFLMVALVLVVAIGVPLSNLVYQAGLVVSRTDGTYVRHWSIARFSELTVLLPGHYERTAIWRFHRELGWTALLAGGVATLGVIMAAPLGWWARRGGLRALPVVLLVAGGLATPGPLIGTGVIWLFTRGTSAASVWLYDQTLAAPLLALVCRALPVAVLVCWFAALTVPRSREDAAALDGINAMGRFWLFGVAQNKLALGVAWLVCVAIASGDLATSILVVPPGVTTLPIRVFNLLHAGVDDQVAALCLLNIGVIVGVGTIILLVGGRWLKQLRGV